MVGQIEDSVLGDGLTAFAASASQILLCSSEPTSYPLAISYLLGFKSWGPGNAFAAPAPATPNGRRVSSVAITDGTITTFGTTSWWAVCGTASLLAHGVIVNPQPTYAGNSFTLASFDVRLPAG
jgi:hypothetical protein